jgi:hypothetical protein
VFYCLVEYGDSGVVRNAGRPQLRGCHARIVPWGPRALLPRHAVPAPQTTPRLGPLRPLRGEVPLVDTQLLCRRLAVHLHRRSRNCLRLAQHLAESPAAGVERQRIGHCQPIHTRTNAHYFTFLMHHIDKDVIVKLTRRQII